jgi:adenylate cyclase
VDPDHPTQYRVTHFRIKDPETNETKTELPTDNRGWLKINYAGAEQSYPHIPASEFFNDRPTMTIHQRVIDPKTKISQVKNMVVNKAEFIKDRILIMGATAIGVYDLRVTPFQENFPGVETHVNVIGNLMSQKFLKTHPNEFRYILTAVIGFGLIVSLALTHLGALYGLLLTALMIGGITAIDRFLFNKLGFVATTALPVVLIFTIYVVITFYKYFTEERKKAQLRSTFSKYVSPAIVDEILSNPDNINLGGRKQKMSVMFSDVRGFTTISEKLEPTVLSDVLNMYLTPMTNIVFANKGTLDKYMGDAIMSFYGAPIYFEDHAIHACRCALQSIEKLWELQKDFQARGLPKIDIGIGINSSDMSVGNMGSEIVRSYTVMGDAVNLGSRLEGINKEYGTRIIISEFTHADVKDKFTSREVDWVRVKGKYQPIKIYELICEGAPKEDKQQLLNHYNEGYRLYRESKFQEALECFNKALIVLPDDPVSKLYVERCQDYIAEPPPAHWDGVFIMKTK